MSNTIKPAPYKRAENTISHFSPFNLACDRIDEAALLCDVDGFIAAATADPQLTEGGFMYFEKPPKRYMEEGGCPYYKGELNGGSRCGVICAAVPQQLHSYVEIKYCSGGRKIYCPIYREKQKEEPK